MSHGQQALYFLYRMAPEAAAYILSGAVAGPVDTDLEALKRALLILTTRHPMLRTTFAILNDEPVQQVHPRIDLPFEWEDASGWDSTQLEAKIASAAYRPFDLEGGPAWRVHVFQNALLPQANQEDQPAPHQVLILAFHHIIGDLWSTAILLPELAEAYRQEVSGQQAELKTLRSTYADHVYREREMLANGRGEAAWEYWRRTLGGDLPSLELPTDRPRPAEQSEHGALHPLRLDRELSNNLKELARSTGTGLPVVMLSALQVLLHRLTGQGDILTGYLKSGRSAATARIFGYFVNPIVIRSRFEQDPSFRRVLMQTRRTLQEGAEHDWYPFELLVSRLCLARDPSRTPLAQVMFSWQKTSRLLPAEYAAAFALGQVSGRVDLRPLSMRSIAIPHRTALFDLSVSAGEVREGVAVTFEYNTDLFDATTIERLARQYRTLLTSITHAPDRPVSGLEILTDPERRQLLVEWNETQAPYPKLSLHQLFEQTANSLPGVTAVVFDGHTLSYGDLNRQANQLAHYLAKRGVGPGSYAGLCCEPSLETVVGALGILKAGAAYLPIDPHYPAERQVFMLKDARARVLVTHGPARSRSPSFSGTIIDLDGDREAIGRMPAEDPEVRVDVDAPAYVIFTSGSTGQPKGAALAHRGVVNLLTDCQRRQAIGPGDPCSWWTSISFDVSVYEIFSALLAGGTLHVVPEPLRLDSPALLDWLNGNHIRHAYLPPFLLPDLADWLERNPGQSELRRLLVGVEPIPEQLLLAIRARVPELHILNGYGPSETTICSTLYDVDVSHIPHTRTPIGKPVINTQIYVLDRHLRPVPLGVAGEIYIGGDGLAPGYFNRPELTSSRFVTNPFADQPGRRLYRTGDLARLLPDGNLEFLGRLDDQFKIHGVRIEPEEIEAALARHPAIREAAVLVSEHARGGRRLVAHVVPNGRELPPPREVRHFLAESLPDYMLPHAFIELDSLPRTPSGKLARRRLGSLGAMSAGSASTGRPPRSTTEKVLTNIWRQVLGVDSINLDESFFELGGDSILALQMVSSAARAGLHLTPRDVFQAPTIAGLAAVADAPGADHGRPEQGVLEGELPLTPVQRWFFGQSFPNPHHWNQALMLYSASSPDPHSLRAAVGAIVAHHDALRLRFFEGSGGWQQRYAGPDDEIPFEAIDLSDLPVDMQATALLDRAGDLQTSLDISTGPLIRVALFHLGYGRPARLLIVVHHLAIDAVSWRILLEDLETVYDQLGRGGGVRLPVKTTSFRQWAHYLNDLAQPPGPVTEERSWPSEVPKQRTFIPVDLAAAEEIGNLNLEGSARTLSTCFSRDETGKLLHGWSASDGPKIDNLLLTCLGRALQRWVGSGTIWIDVEGHGREERDHGIDLSRTVGWFTDVHPIRLDLPLADDLREAAEALQGRLKNAYRGGGDRGVHHRVDGKDAQASPGPATLAQVSFNHLGRIDLPQGGGLITGMAPESAGPLRAPDGQRPYLVEVTSAIVDGELTVDWTYSARLHRPETIAQVSDTFAEELRGWVSRMPARAARETRPSDRLSFSSRGAISRERPQIMAEVPSEHTDGPGAVVESTYPLSPMQQGMLFHSLQAPDSGVYIQEVACTIEGALDEAAFSAAWRHLLRRHAVLRTSFTGEPLADAVQTVHAYLPLPLKTQDWRPLTPDKQRIRFEDLLTSERRRGFDLQQAPLWRLILVRTSDEAYRLLLSHHHALLDGWSLALLFREFSILYEGYRRHAEVDLPEVRPFGHYIAWLQGQDRAAEEAYWRRALAGCPLGSSLPLGGRPRIPGSSELAAEGRLELSVEETSALKEMARRHRLTLGTLIQGGWALILGRRLKQKEVVFGVTSGGRPPELPGNESMVGLFINTLPMRVHLDLRVGLSDWLDRLQQQAAEARHYAGLPLVDIQALGRTRPDLPLFETVLAVENYPIESLPPAEQVGLRLTEFQAIEQTNYPLAIAVIPGRRMQLKASFDSARFSPSAVDWLLREFRELLGRMAASPEATVREVGELPELMDYQPPPSAGRAMPVRRDDVTPRDVLQAYLSRLWADVLQVDRVGVQDDFFELGGNSLAGAVIVSRIRKELGADLPLQAFFEAPTVAELAGLLQRAHARPVPQSVGEHPPAGSGSEASATPHLPPSALVPIQPAGTRPPLFCVHPAGGVVFPYYSLARHLTEDQPLFGLQDPYLFNGGGAFPSIEEMAACYLDAMREIQPTGPYNLLGWSAGGVVAFEIAQQLRRRGEIVAHLVMLDTGAPGYSEHSQTDAKRNTSPLSRVVDWVQMLGAAVVPVASYVRSGLLLRAATAGVRQKPAGEHIGVRDLAGWAVFDAWRRRLLESAETAPVVAPGSSLSLVQMPEVRRVLRMVRHHIRLARRYAAKEYPGRVSLFRATMSGQIDGSENPSLGWAKLAGGGVSLRMIRANHVGLMVSPYVGVVAHELAAQLESESCEP